MDEHKLYTLEQSEGMPPGFTYVDGYDHVEVGTVLVKYDDHLAAVAEARAEEAKAWAWTNERNSYELGIKAARDVAAAVVVSGHGIEYVLDAIDALLSDSSQSQTRDASSESA